jgi:hypothetical protein
MNRIVCKSLVAVLLVIVVIAIVPILISTIGQVTVVSIAPILPFIKSPFFCFVWSGWTSNANVFVVPFSFLV